MFVIINREIQNVLHLNLSVLIIMYMDMMSQQTKNYAKIYILLIKINNAIMVYKILFVKI